MWTLLLLAVNQNKAVMDLPLGNKESKQIHQPLDAARAEATLAAIIINKSSAKLYI